MRVRSPLWEGRRTLDEENPPYPRADHPLAAPSRGKAGHWGIGPASSKELGISEATFHRWRNRYGAMSSQEAKRLKELEKENARMVALSRLNPRYGYRRVCALLRREGWEVNKKRVLRLCSRLLKPWQAKTLVRQSS